MRGRNAGWAARSGDKETKKRHTQERRGGDKSSPWLPLSPSLRRGPRRLDRTSCGISNENSINLSAVDIGDIGDIDIGGVLFAP